MNRYPNTKAKKNEDSAAILLIVTEIICGSTYLSFMKAPPGWAIRRAGLPSLSATKFIEVILSGQGWQG
jgi:hypothetical protein